MSIKTILGYEIQPGITSEEYEKWLVSRSSRGT